MEIASYHLTYARAINMSCKNHQHILKFIQNMMRNGIFTVSKCLPEDNYYIGENTNFIKEKPGQHQVNQVINL